MEEWIDVRKRKTERTSPLIWGRVTIAVLRLSLIRSRSFWTPPDKCPSHSWHQMWIGFSNQGGPVKWSVSFSNKVVQHTTFHCIADVFEFHPFFCWPPSTMCSRNFHKALEQFASVFLVHLWTTCLIDRSITYVSIEYSYSPVFRTSLLARWLQ